MSQSNDHIESGNDPTEEYVRLMNRHERRVVAYVMGLVPNFADADDIIQETRVQLWREFGNYQPDKDFGSWACTLAHYQILSYRNRESSRRSQFSDKFAEALAEGLAARPERSRRTDEALSECLERLSARSREHLQMYYSGEATVEQIASSEGQTASAVYKSFAKARTLLHECIEQSLRRE